MSSFFFCTYIWKVLSQQTKNMKFLIIRLWKFSPEIQENIKLYFQNMKTLWRLRLEGALGNYFCKTFIVYVWQCSEYASGFEYNRFLNLFLVLNMPRFWIYLSWKIRKFGFPKIRKAFLWENIRTVLRAGFLGKNVKNSLSAEAEIALVRSIIYYLHHTVDFCDVQYLRKFKHVHAVLFLKSSFVKLTLIFHLVR